MLTPAHLKLGARIGGALAIVAAFAGWTWLARGWGYDAGKAEGDVKIARTELAAETARADAEKARADFAERVALIESDVAERIESITRKTPERVHVVGRASRENPDFAAMVRPAAMQRVRDEQLDELSEAARRSAVLSAAGMAAVSGAGGAEERGAR
jgi:hypothetical protein